jgi:hypothetical protein
LSREGSVARFFERAAPGTTESFADVVRYTRNRALLAALAVPDYALLRWAPKLSHRNSVRPPLHGDPRLLNWMGSEHLGLRMQSSCPESRNIRSACEKEPNPGRQTSRRLLPFSRSFRYTVKSHCIRVLGRPETPNGDRLISTVRGAVERAISASAYFGLFDLPDDPPRAPIAHQRHIWNDLSHTSYYGAVAQVDRARVS